MRLGIVADAHLGSAGTRVPAFHVEYGNSDTLTAYRLALRRCVREGADGLVLLGDLSHSGDEESLKAGVRTAAEAGLAVWAASGNHDCFLREDAFADAVRQVGADNVRLLTPEGEAAEEGLRLAGFSVESGSWGYAAGQAGRPHVSKWGDDECVAWFTHYPAISFSGEVSSAGLVYGDNLEDLEEVARLLLGREAPTVVVNGHVHLRATRIEGPVLQVSCAALVEPPFEVTLLDLEKLGGGRVKVRRESTPLVPSLAVRPPAFSPPRQEWAFEEGAWKIDGPDDRVCSAR
ncbi:MAG: metallophosphoesterase family protein [Actinomycetota bacterium]|nr:metallophosphoesterase family protein [Actinomycetota bacterium]